MELKLKPDECMRLIDSLIETGHKNTPLFWKLIEYERYYNREAGQGFTCPDCGWKAAKELEVKNVNAQETVITYFCEWCISTWTDTLNLMVVDGNKPLVRK